MATTTVTTETTVDIIKSIDDSLRQIAEYLAWLRTAQEAERAALQARLSAPPPDQVTRSYLSGRWPRLDGDIYGKVPPFTPGGLHGTQTKAPPK